MSYFEDYVQDGLCCECCGAYIGDEPGYVRRCDGCKPRPALTTKTAKRIKGKRAAQ